MALTGGWGVGLEHVDVSRSTATIPNLTVGVSYEIQVRAANAEGPGEWSASGWRPVEKTKEDGTKVVAFGTGINADNFELSDVEPDHPSQRPPPGQQFSEPPVDITVPEGATICFEGTAGTVYRYGESGWTALESNVQVIEGVSHVCAAIPANSPFALVVPTTTTGTGTGTGGGGGGGGGGAPREPGTAVLVIANGWSPSDIGVAAALAARTDNAAVVFTEGDRLSSLVRQMIRNERPAKVFIVGGEAAVSSSAASSAAISNGQGEQERIAGATRVDTAAAVARQILGTPGFAGRPTLFVANGWSPPDIGVAAAMSARTSGSAVLYTSGGSLSPETAAVISEYRPRRVVIVGGEAAISDEVRAAIAAASPGVRVERVAGATRAGTSVSAAATLLDGASAAASEVTLIVANGWSPADIGVASALAARTPNSAVLYSAAGRIDDDALALIQRYKQAQVVLIGGTAAISSEVEQAIRAASLDDTVPRYGGATRIETAIRVARAILSR